MFLLAAGYRIVSVQSSLLRTADAADGLDSAAAILCPVIKQQQRGGLHWACGWEGAE